MSAIGTRTGVGGDVTIPAGFGLSTNLDAFEWRMDSQRTALDDTSFRTTTNSEQVVGGLLSRTVTVRARADRADHPAMSSLQSSIADTNEQPVASLVLKEGVIGTSTTAATITCSALLTGVAVAVVKGATVDYDLTFRVSGDAVLSPAV